VKRPRPALDNSGDIETFDSFLSPQDWAFTAQTIRRAAGLVRQSFEPRMMAGLSLAVRVVASTEAEQPKNIADQELERIDPLQTLADVRQAAVALML